MREPWPFILPLPDEPSSQYRVLTSAFNSEVSHNLLRCLHLEEKTYQKELMTELADHSSKSIIKHLKAFVEAGILEEGVERSKADGRTVWVKWYRPTLVGRWIILLLTPRNSLSSGQVKAMVRDLLSLYARGVARLCTDYKMSPEYFKNVFSDVLDSAASEGRH